MAEINPPLSLQLRRSLWHPKIDGWLIGGFSLLVWFGFTFLLKGDFRTSVFSELPGLAAILVYFINYPHFIVSYKLAYGRGWDFIKSHWPQLIFVPTFLFFISIACFLSYGHVGTGLLNHQRLNFGMSLLILLTVGWHYAKQSFGCSMVMAHFSQYSLSNFQRQSIRWSLLLVWLFTLSNLAIRKDFARFWGYSAKHLSSPDSPFLYLRFSLLIAGILATSLTIYFVIIKNFIRTRKVPSLAMLIPLVAFYLWWIPDFRVQEYGDFVVPFFHSLQYLAFVLPMEYRKSQSSFRFPILMTLGQFLLWMLFGYLAFTLIPKVLDSQFSFPPVPLTFFLVAFNVFINVHHYFIDNVIWRFNQNEIKDYLLYESAQEKIR